MLLKLQGICHHLYYRNSSQYKEQGSQGKEAAYDFKKPD